MPTIAEILELRARRQSGELAYTFLQDGKISHTLTYAELDQRARVIAARLQELKATGPVLLLYPSGLEFVAAFFGCLYAGVIAVPLFPPRRNRTDARIAAVIADARPKFALMPADVLENIARRSDQMPEFGSVQCIATDGLTGDAAAALVRVSENTAYLQYTSGSTAAPKGVVVSQANLMVTLDDLERGLRHGPGSVMVTWLPLFHDLGLIYGILQPLYNGFPCYLMDSAAFSQRPLRWLEAISAYRGTHSAAPNFAYELCARNVKEEEKANLDLRRWQVAMNAAEPVRDETLHRFAEAFASCGFTPQALCPSYGLAESTLKVTATRRGTGLTVRHVLAEPLSRGRVEVAKGDTPDVRTFVGCGVSDIGTRIAIVDPATSLECAAARIGEIWVKGGAVAEGYWQRPQDTRATFASHLADTGEGPFLRTGDLGFMTEGQVFITGRLKDIIIVRGMNYYPQDIELTVERCHPALRPSCGAVFAIDGDGEERLVVAQEVERTSLRNLDPDDIFRAIRAAVARHHCLTVHSIALLRPASILKTSSGKIQRRGCRAAFESGELKAVAQWRQPLVADPALPAHRADGPSEQSIKGWILERLAARLGVSASQIDPRDPFAAAGLDSLSAVKLSGELEDWLGRTLPPTLAFEHPTPQALARFLVSGASNRRPLPSPAAVNNDRTREPIALIGMACRFPGAPNVDAFWRALASGSDTVNNGQGRGFASSVRPGHFLDAIDLFDAEFFGLAPREARNMDPQQRLLLEVAWETMEEAGQTNLAGSATGVFVGISTSDYARLLLDGQQEANPYSGTGSALSIAANRLSYVLDLHGPSWAVDTACSSSLVAVHNACQSIRLGECDMAFAGGVNLMVTSELTAALAEARMLSGDGRCKTFDAEADGYGRGEGCGMVLLKRHADAVKDGDDILAVIAGSAVNQDGRSNGLTAPNGQAQQEVIRGALSNASVAPSDISYVETHGTGTPLGDPIEIDALKAVLSNGRTAEQSCCFGSVKTNVGHLEAAAGIAGLIKLVLCLRHGELPPHLNLNKLNPYIQLDGTPFSIPRARRPWPQSKRPRAAGVSSFGFGGTNAHVIVREGEPCDTRLTGPPADVISSQTEILALSAKSPGALQDLARAYCEYLDAHLEVSLADLCFSANTGRKHFRHRCCIIAESRQELADQLAAIVSTKVMPGIGRAVASATSPGQAAADSESRWLRDLGRDRPERRTTLESIAAFYLRGETVDWGAVYRDREYRRVRLPSYPFQRQRFWVTSPDKTHAGVSSPAASIPASLTNLLKQADAGASPAQRNESVTRGKEPDGEAPFPPIVDIIELLRDAAPVERMRILVSHLQAEVSHVLRLAPGRVPDVTQGFFDMGFDSLAALEFRERLEAATRRQLAPTLAFDFPSIASLATHLLQMLASNNKAGLALHSPGMPDATLAEIVQLSESELEAFVDGELRRSPQ